ncbi:23S rRNA (uracil(1939)-C(5))-methyltransferase RlmD [Anaerosalibacter bizertensis]|uniref:23S rRNA (Uracil(1939)-C(5))-methyltransferase RlmD n=1 Tax=Anaerosalibacter bizertensis TaxID=932217 RepID=A0A844FF68_9FIRM|nr:23S rRNA (uracil(1939)-C(5))-methyltransferase RlmD [Anaerosalibacter bizertensis]MSS42592.1 23S rRNA (uracil(1939)-C(5))-methyltransferase RlmD [Anaerosalibacter bizertensis]
MKGPVSVGDKLELNIIDLTNQGLGVGKVEGFTIFVEGGLPGDELIAEIKKTKKNFAEAKAVEIKNPSSKRQISECKYYKTCGGCQLHELDYRAQLDIKTNMVKDAIERIGKLEDVKINPTIGMETPFRYRNKGMFKVGEKEGNISIGYFKNKSHEVVDIEECIIQDEVVDKVLKIVKEYMEKYNVQAYNKKTNKGTIRDIVTRRTKDGSTMVIIVTTNEKLPYKDELIKSLKTVKEVVSIYQNINKKRTPVVLGNKNIKLYGEDKIVDYIDKFKFYISPNSFFQVNPIQTEVLYKKALEYLDLSGEETVFDLYCGIGTISLFISQKAKSVYGVEIVSDAIKDAKENAKLNNAKNIEFIEGKSEEIAPKLLKEGIKADKIVVDPPRKGCDEKLLETIVKIKPETVVYVSCNPSTLARDLKYLDENGYKVMEVQPVDMFPWTVHVECVTLLTRNEDKE